jgi:hypothetical protein
MGCASGDIEFEYVVVLCNNAGYVIEEVAGFDSKKKADDYARALNRGMTSSNYYRVDET